MTDSQAVQAAAIRQLERAGFVHDGHLGGVGPQLFKNSLSLIVRRITSCFGVIEKDSHRRPVAEIATGDLDRIKTVADNSNWTVIV